MKPTPPTTPNGNVRSDERATVWIVLSAVVSLAIVLLMASFL